MALGSALLSAQMLTFFINYNFSRMIQSGRFLQKSKALSLLHCVMLVRQRLEFALIESKSVKTAMNQLKVGLLIRIRQSEIETLRSCCD